MYPDFHSCYTAPLSQFYHQRGDYWVLENYIPADQVFKCDESVTYTTHGDYTFLDNLDEITRRWQGPISVSVYAPGDDFESSLKTIMYLRDCRADGRIRDFVTFHLIIHSDHMPAKVHETADLLSRAKTDCKSFNETQWKDLTYKRQMKLLYPVNVARNVARQHAKTYFVFPSDIELFPSLNFIPEFLKMLDKPNFSNTTKPRVYVFPIFEVKNMPRAPETKEELRTLILKKEAQHFHKDMCSPCHAIPKSSEWMDYLPAPSTGLSVFNIGKREPPFHHWEPFYVGTNREPLYDERLSWEGKRDKMTQGYVLCVREYEFHVLDTAFLVHTPGEGKGFHKPHRDELTVNNVGSQGAMVSRKLYPEYNKLFGAKADCII